MTREKKKTIGISQFKKIKGMIVHISKNYTNHQLTSREVSPVKVFEDRILYWLLEPLKKLREVCPEDSDFIILSSLFPMFESIGMFLTGENSRNKSKKTFKQGFEEVVGNQVFQNSHVNKDKIIDFLYDSCRSGLAHSGITKDKIIVGEVKNKPMDFHLNESGNVDVVRIDPWKLLNVFEEWFISYIRDLKKGGNKLHNFEKTWNRETPEICGGCSQS
ncbi:MAG: hypothetical protein WC476_03385 [Phycisphaerae bacterium]|jgi:hypothetical protein